MNIEQDIKSQQEQTNHLNDNKVNSEGDADTKMQNEDQSDSESDSDNDSDNDSYNDSASKRESECKYQNPDLLQHAINEAFQAATSNDHSQQLEGVKQLHSMSTHKDPPIQGIVDSGILPRLIEFLDSSQNLNLQLESLGTLINISGSSSGESKYVQLIIDLGVIPKLIKLLQKSSEKDELFHLALWVLGNIAGDSNITRDIILDQDIVLLLILKLFAVPTNSTTNGANGASGPDIPLLRTVTWVFSNLCGKKPDPQFELVAPMIPILKNLVCSSDDEEVLLNVCSALQNLSYDHTANNSKIHAIVGTGISASLLKLLYFKSLKVRKNAFKVISNIVSGEDSHAQVLLDCSLLTHLYPLLFDPEETIRLEACFIISNLLTPDSNNSQMTMAVIEAGLIAPLINIMRNDELSVKNEAVWAIRNLSMKDEHVKFLVLAGVIPSLCEMLSSSNTQSVEITLQALENILKIGQSILQVREHEDKNKEDKSADSKININGNGNGNGNINQYAKFVEGCGGLYGLKKLYSSPNEDISEKAKEILKTYFHQQENIHR